MPEIDNPAAIGTSSDIKFSLANQRLMGNFGKVSTYIFNGHAVFLKGNRPESPSNTIGFTIYNDREGQYLNRTRAYLVYAWKAYLAEELQFSAGLELGIMNYHVRGSDLSGDGSDIVPDGAVGVRIWNESFFAGLSIKQLFNSQVQPLEEIAVLSPYVNVEAGYKFKLSSASYLKSYGHARYGIEDEALLWDLHLNFHFLESYMCKTGIYNKHNLLFGLGLDQVKLFQYSLKVHISYSFPLQNSNLNNSLAELGLFYSF